MGKRECQVCGGPIASGRCKLCGMPYRNDEVMYHLNENRRDHYKHASLKARILMQEDEIPLGDKKAPQSKAPQSKTPQSKTSQSKVAKSKAAQSKAPQPKSQQPKTQPGKTQAQKSGTRQSQTPQGSSAQKASVDKAAAYTGQSAQRQGADYKEPPAGRRAGKGRKKGRLFWIIVLLFVLLGSVPEIADSIEDYLGKYSSLFENQDESEEEESIGYYLEADEDPLTVGEDLESGDYTLTTLWGNAIVRFDGEGEADEYELAEGEFLDAYLWDGIVISVENKPEDTETEPALVYIYPSE